MKKGKLTYPFGNGVTPAEGDTMEIADGVHWLRMPLPYALDHINLWILRDGDAWVIVDTGVAGEVSTEVWKKTEQELLRFGPVSKIIVTHMHPDHIGMAGELCRRHRCPLFISRGELLTCYRLVSDTGREAPEVAIDFFRECGHGAEFIESYKHRFGNYGRGITPLPENYRRLVDGTKIIIDDRVWTAFATEGHSPEHMSLCCPELGLMISGDQLIPRISSNVSVHPLEPDADPLQCWIESNQRIIRELPADWTVLPAHQEPFAGIHTRAQQLIDSHERSLDRLGKHLHEPQRIIDCFSVLFKRPIKTDGISAYLATGETRAHLNWLKLRGKISEQRDEGGVLWYQQTDQF